MPIAARHHPLVSARRSLAAAMLDQLRDTVANGGLAIASSDSGIMADGRPAPMSGRRFYAIHQGNRSNNWLLGDESAFDLMVTISERANEPFDRLGPNNIDMIDGLDDAAEDLWTNIFAHQWTGQYSATPGIMSRANTYLADWNATYGWTEALYPAVMGPPTPVQGAWFMASGLTAHKVGQAWSQVAPYEGMTVQIRFAGAKRLMNNADAEA